MKIGIITLPLNDNYGGILQAYALLKVLQEMGHEPQIISKPYSINMSLFKKLSKNCRQIARKIIINKQNPWNKRDKEIENYLHTYTNNFIIKYIKRHKPGSKYSNIKEGEFNALVVGSDQVWRPIYWGRSLSNAYLSFAKQWNVKRIAYAASFGTKEWQYTTRLTKECSSLAKLFDAVSVREDSGIELCNKNLGVDAEHVLDPTLLLEKEDYINLIKQNNQEESQGNLFCYILDNSKKISDSIKYIEEEYKLKGFQVKAKNDPHMLKSGECINEDHIIPSPTKWLRAFMDAKMVFTDSFHGCVFSIIFNKPFWVLGNKERGNARFDSLLKQFNLESRRIDLQDINNTNLNTPIDWEKVNTIKKEWQKKSFDFLKNNLQ